MGDFNISIPKLGESIKERTKTKIFLNEMGVINKKKI